MKKYFYYFLVIIFIIELAGHVTYFFKNKVPLWKVRQSLQYTLKGGVKYQANTRNYIGGHKSSLLTNEEGLISNGRDLNYDSKGFNIHIFGGSTVEGRGASTNQNTIPAQLEECLNREKERKGFQKKIYVWNHGFSGDTVSQEFLRLMMEVIPFKSINMVIFLDGRNDAHYAQYKEWAPLWNPGLFGIEDHLRHNFSMIHFIRGFLYQHSIVFNILCKIKKNKVKSSYVSSLQKTQQAVYYYGLVHVLANTLAQKLGFTYIGMLQPILVKEYKPFQTSEEEKLALPWMQEANYMEEILSFYHQAKSFRLLSPVRYIDLSDLFKEEKDTLYVDGVHYNDKGHRLIGYEICRMVQKDIFKSQ